MSESTTVTQETWWAYDRHTEKPAIGVVLHNIDGHWTVARTLLGSPAERAGIQKGDVFLAIAGNSLASALGEAVIEKTLSFLSEGAELEVAFIRSQKVTSVKSSFAPLRQLLEED